MPRIVRIFAEPGALAAATSVFALASLTSLGGCATHPSPERVTTRISSATLDGPRVTNVRGDDASPADDLAAAICRRESRCLHRNSASASGAPARGGAACVAEVRPSAVISLDALDCAPAVARAGMKDCLAALSTDDCSSTLSGDPVLIPACRPSIICGVER